MSHPNTVVIEKIYADFAKGDMAAVLAACSEKVTFQLSGKSELAGKYDKSTFVSGFVEKMMELSGGTLKSDVHEVMASDRHAVVLLTEHLTRKGKPIEYRVVHVWRIENGQPVAWYKYLRDQYQFDDIWS